MFKYLFQKWLKVCRFCLHFASVFFSHREALDDLEPNKPSWATHSQTCRHEMVKSMWPHREEQIKRPMVPCLSFFTCCSDKVPWQKQLGGQRVYFAAAGEYSLVTTGKSRQQGVKQLVMSHPQLRSGKQHTFMLSSLSAFSTVRIPSQGMVPVRVSSYPHGRDLIKVLPTGMPLQMCPEARRFQTLRRRQLALTSASLGVIFGPDIKFRL